MDDIIMSHIKEDRRQQQAMTSRDQDESSNQSFDATQQSQVNQSQPQQPSQTQTQSMPPPQQQSSAQSKCIYGKELRCMMYGFGDDKNPYTESVELLEELVLKYITETTKKAMDVKNNGKITVEDIMYLIRKDKRKCDRVKELLLMNEELKKSRKAFDLESLATQKHL